MADQWADDLRLSDIEDRFKARPGLRANPDAAGKAAAIARSPILFRRLIEEARAKGYKNLRITTGAENHAMRALAGKFGAHLAFRDGEFIGTIDLIRQSQAELAKLASASLRARPGIERGERGPMTDEYEPWYRDRSIVAGVHLVRNCNRVYWTLLPGMVGPSRAAA